MGFKFKEKCGNLIEWSKLKVEYWICLEHQKLQNGESVDYKSVFVR